MYCFSKKLFFLLVEIAVMKDQRAVIFLSLSSYKRVIKCAALTSSSGLCQSFAPVINCN